MAMSNLERRQRNIKILKDFFAFKINIFPIIVKILFVLATIGLFIGGMMLSLNAAQDKNTNLILLGLGIAFLGPILLHITFELMLLLFSILRTAFIASGYGRYIACGVATLIFCHIFINIGMSIGIAPVTGLPLPLVSYGGTFMVTSLMALGIVQSVYSKRIIPDPED